MKYRWWGINNVLQLLQFYLLQSLITLGNVSINSITLLFYAYRICIIYNESQT